MAPAQHSALCAETSRLCCRGVRKTRLGSTDALRGALWRGFGVIFFVVTDPRERPLRETRHLVEPPLSADGEDDGARPGGRALAGAQRHPSQEQSPLQSTVSPVTPAPGWPLIWKPRGKVRAGPLAPTPEQEARARGYSLHPWGVHMPGWPCCLQLWHPPW